ncbi:MAG: type II secretion system protein [Armatimonadota bacterium]|nr:type II secretion system protein [Armatimonadota bacterium]
MRCLLPFTPCPLRKKGLTLMELLVVISIIAVLAGLVFVAMGPVRARARLVKCMSNLKNINIAYQMYRQDYDGVDPSFGQYLHCYDIALIPDCVLASELIRYGCAKENLFCPNAHLISPNLTISYSACYVPIADNFVEILKRSGQNSPSVSFPQIIAKRADKLPLFACGEHHELWVYPFFVGPVLRLNGQIEVVRSTEDVNPWEF